MFAALSSPQSRTSLRAIVLAAAIYVLAWSLLPPLLSASVPLDVAESLSWGREWQWGYYKHPPLAPWVLEVFYRAFGHVGPFLLSQLFIVATLWLVWRTGCRLMSRERALLGALLTMGVAYYTRPALEFTTAYLIEKALSVDNIFVFLVVFSSFAVPAAYHHRVLFWGIIGALIMRGIFIAAGTALLAHFHWVMYIFGLILVVSGIKLVAKSDEEVEPENNPIVKLLQIVFSPWVFFGLCTFVISMASHLYVLSKVELSFAYPFLSLAYVAVAVFAYFIFHEDLNAWRIAGIAFICVGTVLIAQSGRDSHEGGTKVASASLQTSEISK